MAAKDVATRLRVWAVQQGLMPRDQLGPNADGQLAAAQAIGVTPIGPETPDLLKGRHINFIGFNNAANEVVVYTSKPVSKTMKRKLPEISQDGVRIAYQVGVHELVGRLPPNPFGTSAAELHNGKYKCGSSIHVGSRLGAGTLGCLVRDQAGTLYGLTNNHISGNCSYASIGLPITAPGPCDVASGGVDPFCIGHHVVSLRMVHGTPDNPSVQHPLNLDAALFRIADDTKVTSLQKDTNGYDTPSTVGPIVPGMTVSKIGRTTGLTTGIVRSQVSGPYACRYKMPELEIDFVVFFEPVFAVESSAGYFSLPGDSGSLVTTLDAAGKRIAVGLVFAGDGKSSFVLPLQPILEALAVTLVSAHNV